MKKILLMVVAAIMAMSASAQETVKKVRLYKGNEVIAEQNYAELDSIVFVDITTPAPVVPDTTPANPNSHAKAFTINSNGDQVFFSQGNLRYQASTNTWRFAENQYDAIGSANANASNIYEGWIDLFGWGTSGYDNTANDPFAVNYQPWSTSYAQLSQTKTIKGTEIESINCEMQAITGKCDTTWTGGGTYKSDDYNYYGYGPSTYMTDKDLTGTSANYDWGVYNAITNGGGQAGLWRTLTYDEWNYILTGRNLAQYLRSQATVCGVHGYVLLPDDFTLPEGLSWNYQTNDWDANTYGPQAWSAMEAVGAVFLPAAGYRYGTIVYTVGSCGYYWSASYRSQDDAGYLYFGSSDACMYGSIRCRGLSVRLVRLAE
ncbi:MAG: hypothetical protein IJ814_02200 [Paludibacteraceae bacterium]|nr:hypothetical protein [Paludibacteraceae bacterium]